MEKHRFTIHRNGDTADSMKQQFLAVLRKTRELEEDLRRTAPNARNYYVNDAPEEDFQADKEEFSGMMRNLAAIAAWAEAGALRAYEQGEKA